LEQKVKVLFSKRNPFLLEELLAEPIFNLKRE